MQSSRWDAQGNVYLVTEESITHEHAREEVGDADGILEILRVDRSVVEIAIWNPDGSSAEMSGNGTRIAARWLAERAGLDEVTVRVGRREVRTRVLDGALVNPHAVVDGNPALLPEIGPRLEVHERFPNRTNVQVARRVSDSLIEARVWERGVGETASSGTSAVAVAAALGLTPATVRFPGGDLVVRFEGARARLTGPARRIV
jgi:diaminopimelate epimerase